MNEHEKNPIELLTDLLAAMTARAVEAERKLAEAEESSTEWYQNWQRKDATLKEVEEKLAAEIREHQNTKNALREALEAAARQEGDQDNGESN